MNRTVTKISIATLGVTSVAALALSVVALNSPHHSSTNASAGSSTAGANTAAGANTTPNPVTPAHHVTPAVPAAPTTIGQCTDANLTVSADPRGVTTDNGTSYLDIRFTNTSDQACRITGFPGVATVTSDGTWIKDAQRDLNVGVYGATSAPRLTLQPGQYAVALVEGVSTAQPGTANAGCSDANQLSVTVPDTAVSHRLATTWPACQTLVTGPIELPNS